MGQAQHLDELASSIDKQIEKYSAQVDAIVEKSSKLSASADAIDRYMGKMDSISQSFEKQVEDAKVIQNQLMIEKMDILISRAEVLAAAPVKNTGSPKKAKKPEPNTDSQ